MKEIKVGRNTFASLNEHDDEIKRIEHDDDIPFNVGELVEVMEYDYQKGKLTGKSTIFTVLYASHDGNLQDGRCVLELEKNKSRNYSEHQLRLLNNHRYPSLGCVGMHFLFLWPSDELPLPSSVVPSMCNGRKECHDVAKGEVYCTGFEHEYVLRMLWPSVKVEKECFIVLEFCPYNEHSIFMYCVCADDVKANAINNAKEIYFDCNSLEIPKEIREVIKNECKA